MTKTPRILTLDIETAPLESYHWRLWDENISLDQINIEWSILSYAAKWLGQKRIIYADTGGRGVDKVRDDKALCAQIWKLLDEADLVIAQNGNSFDIKKINARLAMHGFGPYSPIRKIDTKITSKRYFSFTSNKLEWLAKHLTNTPKSPHKKFPGFELWKACMVDDPKAWAEMKKYNIRDVVATEKLYLVLRPWIGDHPNIGAYTDSDIPVCPKCGSDNVTREGKRLSVKQQGAYHRYKCQDCGGWARGKVMQLKLEKRRSMLSPE
jgi:predicted RNA-binding Zn-ribbon protein involved in translation (DUF1610 family)